VYERQEADALVRPCSDEIVVIATVIDVMDYLYEWTQRLICTNSSRQILPDFAFFLYWRVSIGTFHAMGVQKREHYDLSGEISKHLVLPHFPVVVVVDQVTQAV
jgi:hypothetical protein